MSASPTMKRQGSLTGTALARQVDGDGLVYHQSGLIEGTIAWVVDTAYRDTFILSKLGTVHPDDSNVRLYAARREAMRNHQTKVTFDCLGLSLDPTVRVWSFPSSLSTEPIETHKNFFTSSMAGTLAAAKASGNGTGSNGAVFNIDPSNGNILGFSGFLGETVPDGLKGVSRYYRGNIVARATYYTRNFLPTIAESCKIVNRPPTMPPAVQFTGVTKWLYMQPSLDQIDKAGIWRVNEEFMGGTDRQISTIVYGDGNG